MEGMHEGYLALILLAGRPPISIVVSYDYDRDDGSPLLQVIVN
jgi:hypothetical protein